MSNTAGVLYETGTAYPPPVIDGVVRVAHLFVFSDVILCFVCLRPVAFVPNVASISGLSFLDCSFDFLYRLFSSCH
jgi:hypothetical protein